ncbi:MAG: hypothetical protein H6710_24990 [Myxococcales bacterium]|nr:hypothetical protein [Myxococcales bacterium]MCB9703612.1 hypothetical protein [Myxococcales bacterium]
MAWTNTANTDFGRIVGQIGADGAQAGQLLAAINNGAHANPNGDVVVTFINYRITATVRGGDVVRVELDM